MHYDMGVPVGFLRFVELTERTVSTLTVPTLEKIQTHRFDKTIYSSLH